MFRAGSDRPSITLKRRALTRVSILPSRRGLRSATELHLSGNSSADRQPRRRPTCCEAALSTSRHKPHIRFRHRRLLARRSIWHSRPESALESISSTFQSRPSRSGPSRVMTLMPAGLSALEHRLAHLHVERHGQADVTSRPSWRSGPQATLTFVEPDRRSPAPNNFHRSIEAEILLALLFLESLQGR